MRRGPWLAVIAAGTVLTGVSATGVIAPAEDAARTGVQTKDHVETAAFPRAVDIKLGSYDGANCEPASTVYDDDLDGPVTAIEVTNREAIDRLPNLCVRNDGQDPARLRIRTVDVVGADLTCRPDEGTACDGTGDIELELAVVVVDRLDTCPNEWTRTSGDPATINPSQRGVLAGSRPALVWESSDTIEPGAFCRLVLSVKSVGAPEPLPYEAQTDRLEWRYRISTI